MTKLPSRFCGLHSHSMSIFDSISPPKDHIDFAIKNGMDSLAITDHGTMTAFSHQYLYTETLNKKGIKFKSLYGNESYHIPSLNNWNELYEKTKLEKAQAKLEKKKKEKPLTTDEESEVGELISLAIDKPEEDEEKEGGTVVENEEESKANKYKNLLYQRSHLVLLAKNSAGLKSLFRITSESNIKGFYRYPRVDFDMLRKHANGNIVASSACIAGKLAKIISDFQTDPNYENWKPSQDKFEEIQKSLCDEIYLFQEALGKENYFLELQFNKLSMQHLVNMHLIEASKRTGAQLIVTCDAHYSNPEHWREREIYKILGWQQKNKNDIDSSVIPSKIDDLKCELYPKNASQVWESYKKTAANYDFYNDELICEAIERTHDIAHDLIGDVVPDRKVKLPAITKLVSQSKIDSIQAQLVGDDKENEDSIAIKELKSLAIQGLKFRKKEKDPIYIERLRLELETIKYLKFSKYFLTYAKIMEIIGRKMLTGAARGSSAGSLLAYVLDITQVDPIKYNLLFARFLTRFKKGFPDIDSDSSDRDQAIEIIKQYFGEENVIPVSTFSQLQLASLCKDLAKLFGVPFEEVNSYTGKMKAEAMIVAKQQPGFDAQQWEFTLEVAERDSPSFKEFLVTMEKYPDFASSLKVLFKQIKNIGKHAGGVIITDDAPGNMPLLKAKGGLQTPWTEGLNARHLEEFGFLKFDILGLGTLRMFEDCIKRILKKQGQKYITFDHIKTWYYDNLHPDNNSMDDLSVYKTVFWNKRFSGIFQFVKNNVQEFASKMEPTCINDLSIITSLHRPGPLALGADKLYLNNKLNPDSINYSTPLLKEVLEETSGILVYQEQLQLIYHKLAGVPLDETDNIRKAFTKKDLSNKEKSLEVIRNLRIEFMEKCKAANDISLNISGRIFDDMEEFVAYSFNRSHSISYCITSYICAWLLTYYPDEWVATYIDYSTSGKGKVSGGEDPKAIAITEVKSLGYTIGKPDINFSETDFTMETINDVKTLIPSFVSLKYVGKTSFQEISQFRPYKTVNDLLINCDGSWRHGKFNKRALSTLIKLEAFSSMDLVGDNKPFKSHKQMHTILIDNYDLLKRTAARKKNNDVSKVLSELIEKANLEQDVDWLRAEKIQFSKELAGSVDLDLVLPIEIRQLLDERGIPSIDEIEDESQYHWAVASKISIEKTKKTGKPYLKLRLYGDQGNEVTCFVWNLKQPYPVIDEYEVLLLKPKKSDFGLQTYQNCIKKLSLK